VDGRGPRRWFPVALRWRRDAIANLAAEAETARRGAVIGRKFDNSIRRRRGTRSVSTHAVMLVPKAVRADNTVGCGRRNRSRPSADRRSMRYLPAADPRSSSDARVSTRPVSTCRKQGGMGDGT